MTKGEILTREGVLVALLSSFALYSLDSITKTQKDLCKNIKGIWTSSTTSIPDQTDTKKRRQLRPEM